MVLRWSVSLLVWRFYELGAVGVQRMVFQRGVEGELKVNASERCLGWELDMNVARPMG